MDFMDLLTEESKLLFTENIQRSTDEEVALATTEYTMKGKGGRFWTKSS
jgi:hypothetical protein